MGRIFQVSRLTEVYPLISSQVNRSSFGTSANRKKGGCSMRMTRTREKDIKFIGKRLLVLAGMALASASGWALEPVKDVPPPKYWDHYVVMIWQFKTNVLKDHEKYASININAFHIDRNNPKSAAFSKEHKWPFYVDHAADKGYLHLGKNASKLGKKPKGIIVRPNSLANPATIAKMKSFLDTNIPRAKDAYPLGYALDDEVSLGTFCSPYEVDGSPQSIQGYRKSLKQLYGGDIKKLNAEYGSSYAGFDAIKPKPFEAVRRQITAKTIGKINLSEWCDWHSYMDTQFAEAIAELVRHANSLDPKVPCGFVGGQGPTAFGGYDWRKLSKAAQWCEAYESGGNNEIIRSFWGQKRPLLKTYFPRKGAFAQNAWFLWYYMVHGNRGVICWPNGWFPPNGVAPHIKELAGTFKEVQGPVSKLVVDGEFQYDPVAIYYSHPSIQVTWGLDSASHGGTWVSRSSSMDNNLSTSHLTRMGWSKALEDIGIQSRFYHMDHLIDGQLQKDGVKVLLLNRSLCLSDKEAEAIKKFAANGGTVIADHMCGIFDEHGKARATGALDDLFGVKHDLAKGIFTGTTCTEVDAEKGYKGLNDNNWEGGRSPQYSDVAAVELGLTEDGGKAAAKAGKVPVVIKKGKAVYLNLSTIGYYKKRGSDAAKAFGPFLKGLLADAGVKPRLQMDVGGKPSTTTESIFWKNGDKLTLCVISNLKLSSNVNNMGNIGGELGKGKVKLSLKFAKAVKGLKNERTGKVLGDGASFEDEFTPWEANIYTFTP